jgi:Fe2+ or Zn2+ uptake regulation protein
MLQLALIRATISKMARYPLQILQARGYKVTKPRKLVLEALEDNERPLSPYEIQRFLRQRGKRLNHVTIYRVLDLLCRLNLAHKVLSRGGFVKCHLDAGEGCHHLMVCHDCGAIREFASVALCQEEDKFVQRLGFQTEQHFSEFSGLCLHCRRETGD